MSYENSKPPTYLIPGNGGALVSTTNALAERGLGLVKVLEGKGLKDAQNHLERARRHFDRVCLTWALGCGGEDYYPLDTWPTEWLCACEEALRAAATHLGPEWWGDYEEDLLAVPDWSRYDALEKEGRRPFPSVPQAAVLAGRLWKEEKLKTDISIDLEEVFELTFSETGLYCSRLTVREELVCSLETFLDDVACLIYPNVIYLPEIGGDTFTVLNVLATPGDLLTKDEDPVFELDCDWTAISLLSWVTGRVTAVHVKAGDTIKAGHAILTVIQE